MVLFDQATYDKLLSEAPKFKLIIPSILSDRLRPHTDLAWVPGWLQQHQIEQFDECIKKLKGNDEELECKVKEALLQRCQEAEQTAREQAADNAILDQLCKVTRLANNIRVLANMEDPMGRLSRKTQLADGLILEKTSCPLGVLLVIFESRPDALVQESFWNFG